jgi:TolB-like protein/tetratricopeptide (TPR) repeat protein
VKSFLAELRRRNVLRVTVLYAIVSWLVIQIADIVIPALGIPPWTLSFIIVLVALGAPIALVLAWAYELTPEGIRRTPDVEDPATGPSRSGRKLDFAIIGVLAAALAYVVIDNYVLRDPARGGPTGSSVASIAVLPFIDLSPAKDQEYFTDGMSEEMLNLLAQVEGFRVAGRTSAFSFKGRNEDLRLIGTKLGVENVLEGSVRKQGDQIRVTAQLVKVADGYHLWSNTYDRRLDDVFAIQTDIATQVVAELRKTLLGGTARGVAETVGKPLPTSNVEAYSHYLRGQHLLRPRSREGMETALAEFERALELDPDFAQAHVGIANSLLLLESYKQRSLVSVEERAARSIDRALALDPNLGEAFAMRALLMRAQGAPVSERLPLLERAVAANPSDSQALNWLAQAYEGAGRPEDELRTFQRAYQVDPLAPVILQNYALASQTRGHREVAQRLVSELEVLLPNSARLYSTRGQMALLEGDLLNRIRWAAAAVKLDPRSATAQFELSFAYSDLGDVEYSRRHADKVLEIDPDSTLAMMLHVFYGLQDNDVAGAGAWLKKGQALRPAAQETLVGAAQFHEAKGDYTRALEAVLQLNPSYRSARPEFEWDLTFYTGPQAAFLLRETGDVAQARVVETAFMKWLDAHVKPLSGPERGVSLVARAAMAAAMNDREQLIAHLKSLYATGGAISAWYPQTREFISFRQDREVARLLRDHEQRRAEWRRQLAVEGL